MATGAQTPVVCEFCDSHEDVKFFCVDCQEILCTRCKVGHLKSRKTRNDEIISISDARFKKRTQSVPMCDKHPTEELSLFCLQCEQFICTECVHETHEGHKVISSKKIKKKQDELVEFVQDLQNKRDILYKALDTENTIYTRNTKYYENLEQDITDQVSKIVEEIVTLKEEKSSELSSLQREENQRHTDTCNIFHSQTQTLATVIQLLQTAIDSGVPATMEKAISDVANLVQNYDNVPLPQTSSTKYQSLNRTFVLSVSGDEEARTKQTQNKIIPKRQQDEQDKGQKFDVRKHKTDLNKVKVKSTMKVRDTFYSIVVIVPVENNRIWVAASLDKHLTLVNRNGAVIKESVDLCDGDSDIIDVKVYNDDLLVTCNKRHKVIRLSADGKSKTTFSDMSPYYPWGLCVTYETNVLVCLGSTTTLNDKDTKVVRLNRKGQVIQTVQKDYRGAALYSWPFRVTSLLTGEILVSDRDKHKRVTCVNSSGHQMFAWSGRIQEEQVDNFEPRCITHDKYNNVFITDVDNHRVLMLSRDGTEAKCLLDKTHGIKKPLGIAVDTDGKLWVGCADGNLHVIEY